METIFEGKLNINKDNDGYMFVYPAKLDNSRPKREDAVYVFIKHNDLNTAFAGDIVKIEIAGKAKNKKTNTLEYQARVIDIIKREKYAYVGSLLKPDYNTIRFLQGVDKNFNYEDYYVVIASDKKIYTVFVVNKNDLIDENGRQANLGDKVAVVISLWKKEANFPFAKIIKVLGAAGDNNAEMLAYAIEKGFGADHYHDSVKEAESIKSRGILEEDYINRRDMRNILTFTIDPIDAKDFDDAISFRDLNKKDLQTGEDIFELGVHIADVSFYIKPDMSLDKEAVERQTSVYLVDRVIPMLPEVLSNDLCSLVEGQDRLVMSAIFEMDAKGNIYNEWYGRTVIKSQKRWTYEDAQIATEQAFKKESGLSEIDKALMLCDKIAKSLFTQRVKDGALIIDTEEVKFLLDEQSHPVDVYIKHRQDIHKMIEELMLLANKKVSEFITKSQTQENPICIYRVHPNPEEDRMADLAIFIKSLGEDIKIVDGIIPSETLNYLLLKYKGKKEEDILGKNISKSMAKALYSSQNLGHYGLAFDYYTHFTSPIRRYPDVLAHRLLQNILDKNYPKDEYRKELDQLCTHASIREKEAAEAERASIRHKQVEYMGDRIGNIYPGMISFINRGAVFVEDKKSKSEGLIRMKNLGSDYYDFDEKRGCIVGKNTGQEFHVGDEVDFKVVSVDLQEKTIEYVIV